MAESDKNGATKDTEEREAEAYREFILEEGGDQKATREKVPSISRSLKDTRRLSVDEMRKIAEEKP